MNLVVALHDSPLRFGIIGPRISQYPDVSCTYYRTTQLRQDPGYLTPLGVEVVETILALDEVILVVLRAEVNYDELQVRPEPPTRRARGMPRVEQMLTELLNSELVVIPSERSYRSYVQSRAAQLMAES